MYVFLEEDDFDTPSDHFVPREKLRKEMERRSLRPPTEDEWRCFCYDYRSPAPVVFYRRDEMCVAGNPFCHTGEKKKFLYLAIAP